MKYGLLISALFFTIPLVQGSDNSNKERAIAKNLRSNSSCSLVQRTSGSGAGDTCVVFSKVHPLANSMSKHEYAKMLTTRAVLGKNSAEKGKSSLQGKVEFGKKLGVKPNTTSYEVWNKIEHAYKTNKRLKRKNNKLEKEKKELNDKFKAMENKHNEAQEEIKRLEGELAKYKQDQGC